MAAHDSPPLPTRVRRCRHLLLERREQVELALAPLLASGSTELVVVQRWVALAAHRDHEVLLDDGLLAALAACPVDAWVATATLADQVGAASLQALLDLGLVLGDHPAHAALRARDAAARDVSWTGLAAVAQAHARWQGIDALAWQAGQEQADTAAMVRDFGPPPSERHRRAEPGARRDLPPPTVGRFEQFLAERYTCRNFQPQAPLPLASVSTLLQRMLGVLANETLAPGAVALKKNAPSGGGLHATEAYLLVRHVDGLAPGLQHYLCVDHQLEQLAGLAPSDADALALRFVAGQRWFADAALLLVLTSRHERLHWKYRRHAKAPRVALLDAGHVAMLGYLAAADLGIGAFVTAAVNEIDIEQALGLDPLRESVACVLGFGVPGDQGTYPQWRLPAAAARPARRRPGRRRPRGEEAPPAAGE